MARVYEHKNGLYTLRNEYEVDGMSVEDAIMAVIGCKGDWQYDTEYRISTEDVRGYGIGAVLIERESVDDQGVYGDYEPYCIIGN